MMRSAPFRLIIPALALALQGCGDGKDAPTPAPSPTTPADTVAPPSPGAPDEKPLKPRYIWIDAAANFPRYANSRDNIEEDLRLVASAGFTDIVVDVRPSMGDVLFQTTADGARPVERLDVWEGGRYAFCERTAAWDYLQAFIDAGRALGLRVNAAINTFTGGNLYPYGLGEQGMVFRDPARRGWVTTLWLPDGRRVNAMDLTATDPADALYYGTKFLNPCNEQVQTFLLTLLRDLARYDLDGIFLDRCRFDDLRADFSRESERKFRQFLGQDDLLFPDDVGVAGMDADAARRAKYHRQWLTFRAKTIFDFVGKAVATVRGVNGKIAVGAYVGAWYSTYYAYGVNWASRSYDPSADYPAWASADYADYGVADLLDFMLLGCYASADRVWGDGEWTMRGFARQGRRLLGGVVGFAAGPDVGNAQGFADGGREAAVRASVGACMGEADGYFVFDICHVRQYGYWTSLKEGIDEYLKENK